MTYIIVLQYNNYQSTQNLLQSLQHLKGDFKIVLIDNHSTNNASLEIQNYLPAMNNLSIHFIASSKNGGYAYGNNIGIKYAMAQEDCEYIWILNNDTAVTPNALKALISKSQSDLRIGIIGGKLLYMYDKKTVQSIGAYTDMRFGIGHSITSESQLDRLDHIHGASLFLTHQCVKEVGVLSEEYFLYNEDTDYGFRVRQKGFTIVVALDAIIYHQSGATTGNSETGRERTEMADLLSINNRKILARKFFKQMRWIYLGIFYSALLRFFRGQFTRGFKVLALLFCDLDSTKYIK